MNKLNQSNARRPVQRVPVKRILASLEKLYPEPKTALNYETPFQLLIATILSAQCTDKRVNQITAELFKKYQGPEDFAKVIQRELEEDIKGCGLFRNKSKNIIASCNILMDRYKGEVPQKFNDLLELPGVGRKTANVILSNAFNIPAIAVDTHVFRVSNRLGLATSEDVVKTELQLQKRIPRGKWSEAHHWLIYHGREVCAARRPKCEICELTKLCRHFKELRS